jgi:phosphohistidine swiveling domain-containing protein
MILPFSEITLDQLPLVGGKGLNLARTFQAGLPVPPGFVITTDAYRAREQPEVAKAVADAYRALGGPVAVRSSATAEDLEGASFAGQQETVLNVEGEAALLEAVKRCWSSLRTERAVSYRRARGIAEAAVAMAVVVQKMVPAEVAGVLFTRDPTDPAAERVLVEASWGLGEAVVSGAVTPDRWTLDRRTGAVLRSEIHRKTTRVSAGGSEPVPLELQSVPCLGERELGQLLELARRVEELYGAPQDVEWALAGGHVALLQSRPITAAAGERERMRLEEIAYLRERAEPGGTVWARYSLAEVLPEPLPFTWALWRQFMSGSGGYGRMYRELGYDPDPCLNEDGVLDLIAGRPYFNLSRDAKLYFRQFPYDYPFAKLKADPALAIYPRPEPNLAKAPRGFLLKVVGVTRQMMAAEKTLERAAEEAPGHLEREVFPRMRAYAEALRAEDPRELTDPALLEAIEALRWKVFDTFAPQGLKPSVLAGLAIQKLETALQPALGRPAAAAAVETLLAGAAPAPEYDLGLALREAALGRLPLDAFLARFGHRGPGEMELANPRWREMPGTLESLPPPAVHTTDPGSLAQVIGGMKVDRRKAEVYLDRARRFTGLRETAKHFLMMGYEVLRLLLLEVDRRFDLGGGVFYLRPGELPDLLRGVPPAAHIAERRRRRALALGLEAPRVLFSDDLEALGRPAPPPAAGEELCGTGVSSGVAEGEALVLRSPSEAPAGAREFILVCPSTDPGWTPLFLRARGLVLETGGILSHGAIVAREFGLPAVANIPDACVRLRSGQRLKVDGGAGKLWVL